MKQYNITCKYADLSFVSSGESAEDALINLFKGRIGEGDLPAYMDAYHVVEIAVTDSATSDAQAAS